MMRMFIYSIEDTSATAQNGTNFLPLSLKMTFRVYKHIHFSACRISEMHEIPVKYCPILR